MPDEIKDGELTAEETEAQEYRDSLSESMWSENGDTTAIDIEAMPKTTPDEDIPPVEDADPWESVDPVIKDRVSEMTQRLDSLTAMENRLKQAESRVGSLQNTISNSGKKKLTDEQQAEIDTFKEDFPEFYSVIDHLTAGTSTGPGITPDFVESKVNAVKSEMERRVEMTHLEFRHPDWQEQVQSTDYQKWLIDQKPDIKNLTNSVKATDAIKCLDKFKADVVDKPTVAEVKQQRQTRLKSAAITPGRKAGQHKAEADMSEKELRAKVAREIWPEG